MSRELLEPGKPLSRQQITAGVDGIDWDRWQPTLRGTLGFILQDQRLLLIRKKRGLGAGRITGPGGKLEPGESALDCVVRELQEEVGITMQRPQPLGEFLAQFTDGLAMHVAVFVASEYAGEVCESEEALPCWVDLAAIPYERMWPDNAVWFPEMLNGRAFRAHFIVDYERLFDSELIRP